MRRLLCREMRNDDVLFGFGHRVDFAAVEPGVLKHGVPFLERVRVAPGCGDEHDEGEIRGRGTDPVVIRDKLQRDHPATRRHRGPELSEKVLTFRDREVVQKVGEQNQVMPLTQVDVEGAAGNRFIAVSQGRGVRVFPGHCQDVRPIDGGDFRVRIPFCDLDSEYSMPRGQVQYLADRPACGHQMLGDPVGRSDHHGHHRAGEGDPLRKFLGDGPLVIHRRPAFAHGLGEVAETIKERWAEEEIQRPAEVGRRGLDQKHRRILRQGIRVVGFREKPEHHQIVDQHAQAPLRGVAPVRQGRSGVVPFIDGRENFQVDSGSDGAGALNRKRRFKKQDRRRRWCLCHGSTLLL